MRSFWNAFRGRAARFAMNLAEARPLSLARNSDSKSRTMTLCVSSPWPLRIGS